MVDFGQVRREHVIEALHEYDEVGREAFLEHYGFGPAREYVLVHNGSDYDSKAIVGVAYGYATGTTLASSEFSGGKDGAAAVLRGLGFEVDGPDLPPLRYTNATTVGQEHARATWALAARERLVETARVYHAAITQEELADFVQRRSLIRTSQRHQLWVGDVLARVAAECAGRREPLLSALCVDGRGHLGPGYAVAVELHRGETVTDPDQHAAAERLECYRHFGAVLPEGGGVPALPPQLTAPKPARPRTSTPKAAKPPAEPKPLRAAKPQSKEATVAAASAKPLTTCPVHFTVLPASGVCDLCD